MLRGSGWRADKSDDRDCGRRRSLDEAWLENAWLSRRTGRLYLERGEEGRDGPREEEDEGHQKEEEVDKQESIVRVVVLQQAAAKRSVLVDSSRRVVQQETRVGVGSDLRDVQTPDSATQVGSSVSGWSAFLRASDKPF